MIRVISIFLLTSVCVFPQNNNVNTLSNPKVSLLKNEAYELNYNFSFIDSVGLDSFIIGQMTQHHIPGLAACIVKKNQIIWTGNYGWAYINLNIPIYDSTLFQIASVSKTVTGVALMKLYERGRFNLNDNINNYLPFTVRNPFYPDSIITFKMLLTHTSSIQDNWSFMPYFFHMDPPRTLRDYLDDYFTPDSMYYSTQNFSNYPPGSAWNYSNIGIALAGYLVESITGIELSSYCRDSLFASIGMNESSFFYRDLDTMHMAMPYMYNGFYIPYGHYSYYDYPDGMLKTSTIQLARFLIAFMQKGRYGNIRILDSTTVELMVTPQIPNLDPTQGLVWYKRNLGSRIIWGHNGGDLGISTEMFYYPNDTTGILLFTNGEYPFLDPIMNEMFNYAATYVLSVENTNLNVPLSFKLYQNYPNPFNPVTKIKFEIPSTVSNVKLIIYDILGREVVTLLNEEFNPGIHSVVFDGTGYSSGIYFYELIAESFTERKKMILLK